MSRNIFVLIFCAFSSLAKAQTNTDSTTTAPVIEVCKALADSAYANEHFAEAAALYRQLTDSLGPSPQIFYNIGNCFYRQDSIAQAILYYERALLYDPSHKDARFNLDIARAKTIDKVVPASEMFFAKIFHSIVLSLSITRWAQIAIVSFILALLGLALYLFLPSLAAKKASFVLAIILFLITFFANIAAFTQRSHMNSRTGAIIMTPSVVVKSTPAAAGTDLFILHQGTHVDIRDNSMKDYVEIQLTDGKQGWIPRNQLEII
ncbi:MAG: tetratricopeptide repeat protein [Bacteroidaceae bacterium]|nr:tetratricopeptide repeat protein [Bacteroidaceae bacterium]